MKSFNRSLCYVVYNKTVKMETDAVIIRDFLSIQPLVPFV